MTIAKPGNPHGTPREDLYAVSIKLDSETYGYLRWMEDYYGVSLSILMRHVIKWKYALMTGKSLPELDPHNTATKTYFIQRGDDGPIKIGRSVNPLKRMRQLQIAVAEPLTLLAIVDGGRATEGDLHRRFASTRLEGEWFLPSEELLIYIAVLRGP